MDNIVTMQEFNPQASLTKNIESPLLIEFSLLFHLLIEISIFSVVHYQVNIFVIIKIFVELDDVRMIQPLVDVYLTVL
jgi:E3 ubiquitin-protein ligase DOA10